MKLAYVAAAVCLAAAAATAAEPLPRCDVVPGWTQFGPSRLYASDNLYDYMDGNSEGYLIYGFKQMHGVTCKSGETQFVIDISDMNDAESAFGLFASNRDPRIPTEVIGAQGQIAPQRGIFLKGDQFIEISASPTAMDHSTAIRAFLKALEAQTPGSTAMPAPVQWFPKEGLDAGSVRVVAQSVLGLSILKKGYVATYGYGRAFLVHQVNAVQVMSKLRERFGDIAAVPGLGKEAFTANDKYLGRLLVSRKGEWITGMVNLKDGSDGITYVRGMVTAIP